MKVCIAGGGRVGRYLAQSLLANRHEIVIIEPVESQCRMLADTLDIPVICGDSISVDTLRTADTASCDAFVAVTGSDEDNLVACQIAKREFGVNRTVARASNPKNRELLHTLGVDTVVCGTDNLSHILEREIETDTIRQLLSLGGGTASLNEILLPENFLYAGKAIMDIPIPGDTIPPTGRAVLCVWAAVPGLFAAPFVFWQSIVAGAGFCLLWGFLVYCLWARACSFAAVLGERTVTVYSGVALPVRQVLPRRAVTSVRLLRTPLLRLGGVSLLIVAAPGAKLFLPAIPAQQAGLLAHILAEDAP